MEDPRDPSAPPADPLIGALVDGYRIERLLGAGGMGRVYRARDMRLERDVAIKFLTHRAPEHQARFQREALAISSVNDPNVAAIHTRGVFRGEPYYVMEYLDGGSLARFVGGEERLPLPRAIDFLRQAASGLAAASAAGLVHRDVKPSNLMLQGSERLKVVDFGPVRRLDGDISLTESDSTIGTPHYISPEQALGKPTDLRSDIYSLGATFYHLLSGFAPFSAETPVSLLLQHVNAPLPPLRSRNPRVPSGVARVVEKMLAKLPDERYQSYAELLADLARATTPAAGAPVGAARPTSTIAAGEIARTTPVARPPASDPKRFPLALRVAGVLVVAMAIFFWVAAHLSRPTPPASAPTPSPSEAASPLVPAAVSSDQFGLLQRLSAGDTSPEALAAANGLPGMAGEAVKAALRARTLANMRRVATAIEARYAQEGQEPEGGLAAVARDMGMRPSELRDGWGRPLELEVPNPGEHRVVSRGPDGVRGTADDLVIVNGELEGSGLPGAAVPTQAREPSEEPSPSFPPAEREMPLATRPAPFAER